MATTGFPAAITSITAQAIFFYTLGLPASAPLDVVRRVFYVLQDTKTPVMVSILGLFLNILLSALLVRRMAHQGLALATSLSAVFMFILLIEILRRRLGGIEGREPVRNTGKILLASLALFICLVAFRPLAQGWRGYLGIFGASALVYGVLILLLRPQSSKTVQDIAWKILRHLSLWGKFSRD
ncbi:MAG: lipid II flippase MurJ [Candidatus Caldatribacteriaceae bacterium]